MPDHLGTGGVPHASDRRPQSVVRRVHARRLPREVAPVRSRKLALVIAPFLLLSLLPGVVTAAQPKDTKAAHHAKVVKYWTPERIKNAKPRDFVFDPAKGTYKPAAKPAPPTAAATSPVPPGRATDDILNGDRPGLFTFGGGDYICSGSVVTEPKTGLSIVLTAGHCASENDGQTFATHWMFIPAFDTAPTYTCAQHDVRLLGRGRDLRATRRSRNAGGFNNTRRPARLGVRGREHRRQDRPPRLRSSTRPSASRSRSPSPASERHTTLERLRVSGGRPLQRQGPRRTARPDRSPTRTPATRRGRCPAT